MKREDKLQILERIKEGTPVKFALMDPRTPLYRNKGETDWHTKEDSSGEVIKEEDRAKYLPKAMCFENVSKQFRYKWE